MELFVVRIRGVKTSLPSSIRRIALFAGGYSIIDYPYNVAVGFYYSSGILRTYVDDDDLLLRLEYV